MDKAQKKTRLQLEALESFYAGTLLRYPNLSLCARERALFRVRFSLIFMCCSIGFRIALPNFTGLIEISILGGNCNQEVVIEYNHTSHVG